jgi:hypothetical protein
LVQGSGKSSITISDDVERALTREDYDEGYRAWRDHMSAFDWCIDTGRYGSLGEPGISDLDCAALVRDGCLRAAINSHKTWLSQQSEERQFVFYHDPHLIAEAASTTAPLIHTLYGLRWDGEPRLAMQEVSAESSMVAHLTYALSLAPRCARMLELEEDQSLRLLLLLLRSLHVSEGYWATLAGEKAGSVSPIAHSRRLRVAILGREIRESQLTDIIVGEIKSSIAKLSSHLDSYGSKILNAETSACRGRLERLTRFYGKVSAADETAFDAREHESTLHRSIFALGFGLLPTDTPLGAAGTAFWDAIRRMKAIYTREGLHEDCYLPRPFSYLPGVDDADLERHQFNCATLPTATTCQERVDGRVSAGAAGHLVHGPYVRIQGEVRYSAALSYLTTRCLGPTAGNFEVVASRLDQRGQQMGFTTLGHVPLPATHGKMQEARVEFDTTGFAGALLETRVYVEEGVIMNAFHIRTWRRPEPGGGVRYRWLRFARGRG